MTKNYDVVVIGAGSGGLTSAVGFSKVGKKVLLIEREHMGGECTNTGCIPSKALLHHARKFYQAKAVAGEGAKGEAFRTKAFTYVRQVIDEILAEETPDVFEKIGIDVVMGEAEFTGPRTVKVAETTYEFEKAIIATGSSPRMVEVPGLTQEQMLTNQNIFDLKAIPERLLIIGSGPIGMELGQAFSMLGSNVTIASIDHELGRLEDPAIRPVIARAFAELGVTIELNAHIKSAENGVAAFEIKDTTGTVTEEKHIRYDKVLIAIGRTPNLPQGLAAAGIAADKYGITVNKNQRTSNKAVYAVGDVAQRLKFTHTADDTARQVVTHVVSKGLVSVKHTKQVPKVTYITPEVGQVGLSHDEAVKKYGEESIMRIEAPLSANDRAKAEGTTEGIAVVIVKRLSGKVLGAHVAGPAAGELIGIFTLAIDQNISLWKLRNTIFAYPTYSLIIKKLGDYFFAQQVGSLKPDLILVAKKQVPKVIGAVLWITSLYLLYRYQSASGLTTTDTAFLIFDFIALTVWGPVVYILLYTVRPITFFPATILTILSGIFFGLLWGTLYTIIAATLASGVAYAVGRFFGAGLRLEDSVFGSWVTALRENTFTAILTMRLIFLPFDAVSYLAGILKVQLVPFLTATLLGIILGTATFVSIGASLDVETLRNEGFSSGVIGIEFILLSALIFVASLGVSKLVKKRAG